MKIQIISWGEIDLNKEIAHVKSGIFTLEEETKLLELYDRFFRGHFIWCADALTKWSRSEREYVNENVFNCLAKVANGEANLRLLHDDYKPIYSVVENEFGERIKVGDLEYCQAFIKCHERYNDSNSHTILI